MEGWGGSTLSFSFRILSKCVFMCVCVLVCKTECLSIAFPCVAKQPCVCTLKWGWKREGKHQVNRDRRSQASLHLIEHTSAPDEWGWPLSLWLAVDINCGSWGPFLHSTEVRHNMCVSVYFSCQKRDLNAFWGEFLLYVKEIYFPTLWIVIHLFFVLQIISITLTEMLKDIEIVLRVCNFFS